MLARARVSEGARARVTGQALLRRLTRIGASQLSGSRGRLLVCPHRTAGRGPAHARARPPPPSPAQDGATPLFVASQKGNVEVVTALLASGADKEAKMPVGARRLRAHAPVRRDTRRHAQARTIAGPHAPPPSFNRVSRAPRVCPAHALGC